MGAKAAVKNIAAPGSCLIFQNTFIRQLFSWHAKKHALVFFGIFLMFFISVSYTFADLEKSADYYNRKYIDMELTIANELEVIALKPDYVLREVNVEIGFVPNSDFRQEVLSIQTTPSAKIQDGIALFNWKNPAPGSLSYEIKSNIRGHNTLFRINEKVDFPIRELNPVVEKYVKETETIDFKDQRIINIASELAGGEDDLYVVVHNFAEWVNKNIAYDLNTLTADASQKASWVLENRMGVCDEITNLFIALCRAVNVPARFVSGLAYTEAIEFEPGFSPHGWAEVYFLGYGWVPFDVTFGQFGYVDAAHISLKHSDDANKSSSKYEWEGRNVQLRAAGLDMNVEVTAKGEIQGEIVGIKIEALYPKVTFGSYNVLKTTLSNQNSHYVPVEVMFSRTEQLDMFNDYKRYVLLKPYEVRPIYSIFKVSDSIDTKYIYTFTSSSRTNYGAESVVTFTSSRNDPFYTLPEVRDYVNSVKLGSTKSYSEEIDINCTFGKENYQAGEDAAITCVIKNMGNVMLQDIKSCLEAECTQYSLRIGEEKTLSFLYNVKDTGNNKIVFTTENEHVSKTKQLLIYAWDKPEISIELINAPESVSFDEEFEIEFGLNKENPSLINSLNVVIACSGFDNSWHYPAMEDNKRFIIRVGPKTLKQEDTFCKITADYKDALMKSYSSEKDFAIRVSGIGAFDKILIWLESILKKIGIG